MLTSTHNSSLEISRLGALRLRLSWLLVFRGAVATLLLLLTAVTDFYYAAFQNISWTLYAVAAGNFGGVLALGLLLRAGINPVVLSAVYLAVSSLTAVALVHVSGVIESYFTFLYILSILDGAIVGGRNVALVLTAWSSLAFGGQLAAQMYGLFPPVAPEGTPTWRYTTTFVFHLAGFFGTAMLAGRLMSMVSQARAEVTSVTGALRDFEFRHQEILATLPVGVVSFDQSYLVINTNHVAESVLVDFFGWHNGELLPRVLQENLPTFGTLIEKWFHQGDESRYLSLSLAVVQNVSSSSNLHTLVMEDRTALQELQRRLGEKERLAAIGELSAAMAHEIRNPLASISGSVELMFRNEEFSRDEKLQAIVSREVERLDRLLSNFLRYARPANLRKGNTNISEILDEIVEMASQDLNGAARVECHYQNAYFAEIDGEQVRQVLWNLLRNALDASPDSASVTVAMRQEEGDKGAMVLIEISDEGEGIPAEDQKNIFRPFFTTKRGGTGLGLATVHRIVTLHGGEVALRRRDGGGTVACIWLPIKSTNALMED